MLQIFRTFKGIDKLEPDQFFSLVGETATRGHPWKIFKPQNKNIIKCNTLASRAVNDWNALSKNTVLAPTLNILRVGLSSPGNMWIYLEQIATVLKHTFSYP